jgi:cyclin-dependent kinase 12/13
MLFITEPLVSLKKKRTGIRPRKAMGCVQGKYSVNSSPTPGGLEKLKMESGYVGKGDIAGHRRSTGQRYSGRLPKPEQPTRKYNGGRAGIGEERKLSDTGRVRFVEFGGEEVVDGWPKWLTDNVPREVLGGLIPKSAENYDKLAKVSVLEFFFLFYHFLLAVCILPWEFEMVVIGLGCFFCVICLP